MSTHTMEYKVADEIQFLTELQEIDDELKDLFHERGDLPQEVERLNAKIHEFESFITQKKTELEHAVHEIAHRSNLLEEVKGKLEKYQKQLYEVKTTREYDAITLETNVVKSQITEHEKAVADQTSRQGVLTQLIETRSAELEQIRTDEKNKAEELKQKLGETEGFERELMHRRDNLVVRVKQPLYRHYERIRLAKDGRGVARIPGGACGGCFAMIPPQTQAEIRKMHDIVLCETCGRILVP